MLLAHWGKRESFSFAKEDVLFYSFCSLFFIDRQLCLREGRAALSAEPKTAQMPTNRLNSHTDWSARLRLRKTATPNLLLKSCCNFQICLLVRRFLQDGLLVSGAVCSRESLCLIFRCCFYLHKVGHFGDKFLCRRHLLAYIYRHITLQYILHDFSLGAVQCKVVQVRIIFHRRFLTWIFKQHHQQTGVLLDLYFDHLSALCINMFHALNLSLHQWKKKALKSQQSQSACTLW